MQRKMVASVNGAGKKLNAACRTMKLDPYTLAGQKKKVEMD